MKCSRSVDVPTCYVMCMVPCLHEWHVISTSCNDVIHLGFISIDFIKCIGHEITNNPVCRPLSQFSTLMM